MELKKNVRSANHALANKNKSFPEEIPSLTAKYVELIKINEEVIEKLKKQKLQEEQ